MISDKPIAIVYDFDGTLSPKNMQEETIFPALGIDGQAFWAKCNELAITKNAEPMLIYLGELMTLMKNQNLSLKEGTITDLSAKISLYEGVESWFDRINGAFPDLEIRHYIVSAGIKEILRDHSLAKYWTQIYASEFDLDDKGIPFFLKQLVTDTTKTQFLFRINKGREEVHECVNEHMDEAIRPVPFENFIYIGDGLTDVPSLAVVRQHGGSTIAVYNPETEMEMSVAQELVNVGRADVCLEANYSEGAPIENWVKDLLRKSLE